MTAAVRVLVAILFNRAPDQLESLGKFRISAPAAERVSSVFDAQLALAEHLRAGDSADWGRATDYDLYDWGVRPLPRNATVGEVPRPGVFFALREVPATGRLPVEVPVEAGLTAYKELVAPEDEALSAFLASGDAQFAPARLRVWDVFICYSSADESVAHELRQSLRAQDLSVFLASDDIPAGAEWRDELRRAMLEARVVLTLLTPNSISSQWVSFELSAARSLGKPVLAGCLGVDCDDVATIIPAEQCRSIQSTAERRELVQAVVELCGS